MIILFIPENTSNQLVNYSYSQPGIVEVVENGRLVTLAKGIVTVTATTVSGGKTATCLVTVEDAVIPVYKEEVFLDFESIVLDWASGYGAFSWNTDQQMITGNPSVDAVNTSSKVYKWTRDIAVNATWGGYAIGLPTKNTNGWERISFQVYASNPVTTIRVELFQTDVSQGNFTISNLTIPANTWETVKLNMIDAGMVNKTFDKVQMQIAGGSDVALMSSYSDNFKFEKGLAVSVPDLISNDAGIRIYPNPAKEQVNVECPNGLKQIEIFDITGKKISTRKFNGEPTFSFSKKINGAGLIIAKIIDTKENLYLRKLLFN